MEFIREIRRVEADTITINLPREYRDQEVEVIVLPLKRKSKKKASRPTYPEQTRLIGHF
ncbi:MAG: hypothetical protein KAT34_00050 [Candidatus Aminicenantes bacterium]|nr:hypothetical protein [Candidatus Aminicenantes bacterium]